jgi:hypothetical protein
MVPPRKRLGRGTGGQASRGGCGIGCSNLPESLRVFGRTFLAVLIRAPAGDSVRRAAGRPPYTTTIRPHGAFSSFWAGVPMSRSVRVEHAHEGGSIHIRYLHRRRRSGRSGRLHGMHASVGTRGGSTWNVGRPAVASSGALAATSRIRGDRALALPAKGRTPHCVCARASAWHLAAPRGQSAPRRNNWPVTAGATWRLAARA